MNLFVAKLSPSTTGDDLEKIFSAFGEVSSAKVIIDRETQNSKGFGFVEMPSKTEAQSAIDGLHGKELKGGALTVNEARPRTEKKGGGRGKRGQV